MIKRCFYCCLISVFPYLLFSQNNLPEKAAVYTSAVYFDFGKHDLRSDADPVLTAVQNYITDKKNLIINITAHTDSIGSLENNMALSQRRSEAVKTALAGMGVADSLLNISLFGETKPAAENSTDEGRQRNRRATIEVINIRSKKIVPQIEVPKKDARIGLLEGYVLDAETEKGLSAMVIVRGKDFRDTLYTDASGYFSKKLPVGMVVGVDAFAECYFFATEMTKVAPRIPAMKMLLLPALNGKALALDNLYFVGNQPVLLPKSKPELPKILRFLKANPKMKIEIAGHVNLPRVPPVDVNSWNYKLSSDRAKTVYEYLADNGIEDGRISYKGYGNWEMVKPNAISEADQAKNRRVEMKVLEGGCE